MRTSHGGAVVLRHMQIGEVAERTGLSLRTIRYYEEVRLVVPTARSHGGFRLYTEADVTRLTLVMRMKPLGFSLEEVRDLLTVLDGLERAPDLDTRTALLDRLLMYREVAKERCQALRHQLEEADEFAGSLRKEVTRQRRAVRSAGPHA